MEKRLYPRVATNLTAVITNEEGIKLNVRALDASCEGFSIECSTTERNRITPNGSFVRNGKPIELYVSLDIPEPNGELFTIEARCQVAFSRRVANDKCKMGMRYTYIGESNYKKLVHFIQFSLSSHQSPHH